MLEKTRGIVLKVTDYSDTSLVVQVFTEEFGLQSYLVQGAKRPRAKIPANMFQPLQLLEMVVRHKTSGGLQRIQELKLSPPLLSIPYDVSKSCIALFINEVLYKALRQAGPDHGLFNFLNSAIVLLDSTEHLSANFHLHVLLGLMRHLGIQPAARRESERYFDLKDGVFSRIEPAHPLHLTEPLTTYFAELLGAEFEDLHGIRPSRAVRRALSEQLIVYYQIHLDGFGEIKSLPVLEEVLR